MSGAARESGRDLIFRQFLTRSKLALSHVKFHCENNGLVLNHISKACAVPGILWNKLSEK